MVVDVRGVGGQFGQRDLKCRAGSDMKHQSNLLDDHIAIAAAPHRDAAGNRSGGVVRGGLRHLAVVGLPRSNVRAEVVQACPLLFVRGTLDCAGAGSRGGGGGTPRPAPDQDQASHHQRGGSEARRPLPCDGAPVIASSRTSRKRSTSLAGSLRNAAGGSRSRAISVSLTFLPLGVTISTLMRRSAAFGRRTTSPASSSRSVGSTTVDGLQWRRLASSFCEIVLSGSSCTSAQAETGDRPASAATAFIRASQLAYPSIIKAHSS